MHSFDSVVPVALAAKLEKARVVTSDFAHNFAILLELSPDEVLLFKHVAAVVVVGFESIRLVFKRDALLELVAEGTHKETVNFILRIVVRDLAAIFENNFASSKVVYISRLEASFDRPLHVPSDFVVFVIHNKAGDRRVVRDLLKEDE